MNPSRDTSPHCPAPERAASRDKPPRRVRFHIFQPIKVRREISKDQPILIYLPRLLPLAYLRILPYHQVPTPVVQTTASSPETADRNSNSSPRCSRQAAMERKIHWTLSKPPEPFLHFAVCTMQVANPMCLIPSIPSYWHSSSHQPNRSRVR
jgi:hypothetical protein